MWDALEAARIPFTCHWGQLHGLNPRRVGGWFGERVTAWKGARDRLLDPVAKRVFSAALLAEVGLD